MIDVLFPLPFHKTFRYEGPANTTIMPGQWVRCPWGKSEKIGLVWHEPVGDLPTSSQNIKKILQIYEMYPPIPSAFCRFVSWSAQYTMTPLGSMLKMIAPIMDVFKESHLNFPSVTTPSWPMCGDKTFSVDQQDAIDIMQRSIQSKLFCPMLLDGVTGSGKTEVFLEGAFETLKTRGQVLFLLPEISLSPQLAERFERRFGVKAALWHSDLTPAKRRSTWQALAQGSIQAVIGARSALFLPFQNLRFIVVDEEHSPSYKQEQGIIYQARDMAVMRAKFESFSIVLASATPSLETWHNALQNRYDTITLKDRYKGAKLPEVIMIDRRQEKHDKKNAQTSQWISNTLMQATRDALKRHEQILLFLNRRGYAPLTLCGTCGHRLACHNCSAWLIYHKKREILTCHHCGYMQKIPESCPACLTDDSFVPCGPGVERLYEDVQKIFPDYCALMMTSDTMTSPKVLENALHDIHEKRVDIIIGTQMMAKGHDFPNLTVVGVIDADMSLMGGDLRAAEKTFQLLHQVGGRAGRAQKPGAVYVQSYAPDHPVYHALCHHDRDQLMHLERQQRQESLSPPFARLAALILSCEKEDMLISYCRHLKTQAPHHPEVHVLGPAPAPLYKRLKRFRYRFLIESPKIFSLQGYLQAWLDRVPLPSSIKLTIDIDPYTFL